MSDFLTDGQRLYEIVARVQNYGLAGGWFTLVVDCMTGECRRLDRWDVARCDRVARVA